MGGKSLKFPTRKKYVPPIKRLIEESKEKEETITEEERKRRIEHLKSLGLLK